MDAILVAAVMGWVIGTVIGKVLVFVLKRLPDSWQERISRFVIGA